VTYTVQLGILDYRAVLRIRLDPHHFGKRDPEPHQNGKLDTDPHQTEEVEAVESFWSFGESKSRKK
jgi:hypothetical protein